MSETFHPINKTGGTQILNLKINAENVVKEFAATTEDSPAILCIVSSGKLVPAVAPTTTPPDSTSMPLYVYRKGTYEYSYSKHYGNVDVLGAAGIVRMTLAANAGAITAGTAVVLTGSTGKIAPIVTNESTNYQTIVGVSMESKSSSTSDQEIIINSCLPRVQAPVAGE